MLRYYEGPAPSSTRPRRVSSRCESCVHKIFRTQRCSAAVLTFESMPGMTKGTRAMQLVGHRNKRTHHHRFEWRQACRRRRSCGGVCRVDISGEVTHKPPRLARGLFSPGLTMSLSQTWTVRSRALQSRERQVKQQTPGDLCVERTTQHNPRTSGRLQRAAPRRNGLGGGGSGGRFTVSALYPSGPRCWSTARPPHGGGPSKPKQALLLCLLLFCYFLPFFPWGLEGSRP